MSDRVNLTEMADGTVRQVQSTPVPSVGRIVHYVLPLHSSLRPDKIGDHRPAMVVRVWGEVDPDTTIQLSVFLDGKNDMEGYTGQNHWATSVRHDEVNKEPGTWHWPEFVPNIVREVPEKDEVTTDE
jgi:hypothetical protein